MLKTLPTNVAVNKLQILVYFSASLHTQVQSFNFVQMLANTKCLFQGPDDLFETISQALVNAFDRDAVSGWGAVVYIM